MARQSCKTCEHKLECHFESELEDEDKEEAMETYATDCPDYEEE